MPQSLLLLLCAQSASVAPLVAALAEAARINPPAGAEIRCGASQGDAFIDGTAHGEVLGERSRFDAFVWARSERSSHAELARALEPVCELARKHIDVDRAAVLAGVERSIMAGADDELMVFAFRRRRDLTQAQCQAYWHDNHGAIVRRSGSGGYRQLHVDSAASERIARQLGFGIADYDGAVLKQHRGVDALHAMFANAQVRTEALADECVFIDHARSGMVAFSEIPPAPAYR